MQSVPPAFAAATRRVAGVGELGDGQVYRLCRDLQRELFDPPELDGRMPRVSKWER